MSQGRWDVIIVGGGSAGLSAALTLGRARRVVLVIDSGSPRNRFAAQTQGLLGHDGIDPAALLQAGRDEVRGYGVELRDGAVETVEESGAGLRVTAADGAVEWCRALIVASGMSDRLPEIPGLTRRWGSTVLHCPYCHGWEVRDRRLGVLATSQLGLHQAQLVRQWSSKVMLFTAGAVRLDDLTRQRLAARDIQLVDSPIVHLLGDTPRSTGVRTGDGAVFELDALFIAADATPHDAFVDSLDLARADTPLGSFLAVDPAGKTSHDRVWAAGNVSDPAANVAKSISQGMWAAAATNTALVTEEFDAAQAHADTALEAAE